MSSSASSSKSSAMRSKALMTSKTGTKARAISFLTLRLKGLSSWYFFCSPRDWTWRQIHWPKWNRQPRIITRSSDIIYDFYWDATFVNDVGEQWLDRLNRGAFEVSQYWFWIVITGLHYSFEELIIVRSLLSYEQSVNQWNDLWFEQSMQREHLVKLLRAHL